MQPLNLKKCGFPLLFKLHSISLKIVCLCKTICLWISVMQLSRATMDVVWEHGVHQSRTLSLPQICSSWSSIVLLNLPQAPLLSNRGLHCHRSGILTNTRRILKFPDNQLIHTCKHENGSDRKLSKKCFPVYTAQPILIT